MISPRAIVSQALVFFLSSWAIYDLTTHHLPEQKAEENKFKKDKIDRGAICVQGETVTAAERDEKFCFDETGYGYYECITTGNAIELIVDHLGVKFHKKDGVRIPPQVVLVNKKKRK